MDDEADADADAARPGVWVLGVDAVMSTPFASDDLTERDPSLPRRRRWFLYWAMPLLVLIAAALMTKLVSELRGEPPALESAAVVLGIAVPVYVSASVVLCLLGAAVWAPVAYALRVHRCPCPWCGLTTDTRDPECRHCHRPIVEQ